MVILTGILIVYFVLLTILLVGWNRARHATAQPVTTKEPLISVIVPVRNEEMTIGNLLADLSMQEYKNFEIIIVNDDSEDETLWMVSRFDLKNLQVVHNKGKGKKAAITAGVRAARAGIIVTTDADCSVTPKWLQVIRSQFKDPRVMMAFGAVRLHGDNSFFHALQALEFSSLVGTGAATAALGSPMLCNGANLAFRKKSFTTVKGYDGNLDIPSGDDEFLMRKIARAYPDSVHFINSQAAIVATASQPDLRAFYNQRLRWASKWRYNSSLTAQVTAVVVVLFQMACVANWFFLFSPMILQAMFLIAVKMLLEAAFLLQVCRFLGTRWNWLAFFALQFLYPFYVIGVSVTSFFKPFRWKNRIFRP